MTLQHIFIANLKAFRKERGLSQMTLSEKCDTSSNYMGQIEMGRRIPSFEKIEEIAAALEVPSFELFMHNANEKKEAVKPSTKEYLQRMPKTVKKEIMLHLLSRVKKEVNTSFDADTY